jgi:uroporphyrinogen-III synthase
MDTLPRTLAQHDVSFDTVNSYVTVPHPQLHDFVLQLSHRVNFNYLVFFSPSGVNFSLPLIRELDLIANAKVCKLRFFF